MRPANCHVWNQLHSHPHGIPNNQASRARRGLCALRLSSRRHPDKAGRTGFWECDHVARLLPRFRLGQTNKYTTNTHWKLTIQSDPIVIHSPDVKMAVQEDGNISLTAFPSESEFQRFCSDHQIICQPVISNRRTGPGLSIRAPFRTVDGSHDYSVLRPPRTPLVGPV